MDIFRAVQFVFVYEKLECHGSKKMKYNGGPSHHGGNQWNNKIKRCSALTIIIWNKHNQLMKSIDTSIYVRANSFVKNASTMFFIARTIANIGIFSHGRGIEGYNAPK